MGQGHKRIKDQAIIAAFQQWIESLDAPRGESMGGPQCTDLEKRCVLDLDEED